MQTHAIQDALGFTPPLALAVRRPCVVLVEDDDDTRRLLAARLRSAQFDVMEVADAATLHECLDGSIWRSGRRPIDAILSDVQMPGASALDVLSAVPGRDYGAPVILITAYGTATTRLEARRLGALALLPKPIDWPLLQKTLRRAVSIARVRRRWKRHIVDQTRPM